jgi:hypothetical protein
MLAAYTGTILPHDGLSGGSLGVITGVLLSVPLPGQVTQRPRQVIVPVDQREPPEHVPRPAVEVSEVEIGHLASLRAWPASAPGSTAR